VSGIYWLASYPKSGNTWLRVLLTNYQRNSNEPADINDLDIDGIGFDRDNFDEWLGIDSSELTRKQIAHYRPMVYERMAAEGSGPLFLKVHDAFDFNDDGRPIFPKTATAGVIYLIRNPLELAVSYAHHQAESFESIIRFMRSDDAVLSGSARSNRQLPQRLGSWSGHVCSWVDQSDLRILVVRYEDMIQQTDETFAHLLRFAGLDADAGRVRRAVEFSSFEKLQAQEASHGFKEKQPSAASFFRKGTTSSWRKSLSVNQIRQIISDHQPTMRRFGYLTSAGDVSPDC
jgi:hypothetical protein